MVNTCCVLGCRSNYKSIKNGVLFDSCTFFHKRNGYVEFKMDLTTTKNIVVRIKHFHEDDIIRFKIPITKTGPSAKVYLFQ